MVKRSNNDCQDDTPAQNASEVTAPGDILDGLAGEILAIEAEDKDAIIDIGSRIEQAAEAAADDGDIAGLLGDCLAVLQGAYSDDLSDPDEGLSAVATAADLAFRHLAGEETAPEELTQAKDALDAALATADQQAPPEESDAVAEASIDAPGAEAGSGEAKKPDEAEYTFESAAVLPDDADMELLGEFAVECLDHIAAAEGALLVLETEQADDEQINVVFRAFHTIKGTSGFLGLDRIQRLAHLAENLLDRAREGEVRIVGGYADLALQSCDLLRSMIEGLADVKPNEGLAIPDDLEQLLTFLSAPEHFGYTEEEQNTEPMRVGDILVGKGIVEREALEEVAARQGGKPLGEALVGEKAAKATDVADALRTQEKLKAPKVAAKAEATVRVGLGRLDSMINMVGELVIAQSMVAADPTVAAGDDTGVRRKVTHAGKIIRELQDTTMSLRMVPLKATFQKMTRLVRDLGKKSGKSIALVTEGEDTEIDRNMVEALSDPLVHMIRNSCDHGIESVEDRLAAGKSAMGTVTLRAFHSAGNVVIQLVDDGKGLDRQKILAKAVERGMMDADKTLADSEAFMLIFQPGFSTADKVTDVSGRGVGMDVVRKAIDSLRGRIEVESAPGQGSTFSLRLPLTMAITDAMLVTVGGARFLLPTISIEQSFRPSREAVSTVTGRGEVVMLRGNLLPIFRLHRLFDIAGATHDLEEGLLIVIEGEGKRCALMVDELLGQQQVVIKSLGTTLGHIRGVSGGAILGDGHVGLILDAAGLVELAGRQGAADPAAARFETVATA